MSAILKKKTRPVAQLHAWAQFSISQLSSETGLDRQTVRKRLDAAGVVPEGMRSSHPTYRLRSALPVLYEVEKTANDPERLPPVQRQAHYRAEREKDELLVSRGELMPAEDVREQMYALATIAVRDLELLPDVLERDCGLTPKQASAVERLVDSLRRKMAEELRGVRQPG